MLNHKTISGLAELEKTVAESPNTIVVKFSSSMCGPCKQLNKTLEDYNLETNVDLLEVSLDDEKNFEIARLYDVVVVPTLLLMDNRNNVLKDEKGAMDIEKFYKFIKQ